MKDFVIVTDSCCDLPATLANELELTVIPLSYELNGTMYQNDLDYSSMSSQDFYQKLRENAQVRTSAISVGTYMDVLEPLLMAGNNVLVLVFSSGLSNTYNASTIAVSDLSAKYPDRKIYAVDTLCASLGQGLLVYYAAKKCLEGMDIDTVRTWVEENKLHLCHWFTVSDLNHLKRGGRISATTALLGSMLGIKPVLHVDDEGHLINVSKARGRAASLKALVDHMADTAINPKDQIIFISHGDCLSDAEKASEMVKSRFGVKEVLIHSIGPVIGCHSGPGTLALFFLGTKR